MKISARDKARVLWGLILIGVVAGTLYITKSFSPAKLEERFEESLDAISRDLFSAPREPFDDDWRIVG